MEEHRMENFRVAVLADIHGNLEALMAVLDDLNRQPHDRVVFAGDLVMNGPRPAETVDCIMSLKAPGVIGNTDRDVILAEDLVAAWTSRQMGPERVISLRSLPLSQRIPPPGCLSVGDDLLVVHSTPRSYDDLLILTPEPYGTIFTQSTPLEDAMAMIRGVQAGLITYGHIHYFSEGRVGEQRVMSIGSVGFPFDGDRRAAYAIAHWDGSKWELEPRRVSYDYEKAAIQIEKADIPFPTRYARMIREARWLPRPNDEEAGCMTGNDW